MTNITNMDELIFSGCFWAVVGYVWHFLTMPGELLAFWPKVVRKVVGWGENVGIDQLPFWKFAAIKLTFYCPKCITGQLAFWLTPITFGADWFSIYHVFVLFLSIFISLLFEKFL